MKPSKTLLAATACALAVLAAPAAQATGGTVILNQNFNDVGALSNWVMTNNSVPAGQSWFQGNPGIFGAQAGAADAYIAATFLSAAQDTGTIDNWLITPQLTLGGATHLSFYTRSQSLPGFNDMLEVRFSPGSGTATGGFTTLLTTIGGPSAYPGSWQQFTADLNLSGTGRFAFRYLGDPVASHYIGIDTVTVSAVPEPTAWLMLGLGLATLPLLRRKSGTGTPQATRTSYREGSNMSSKSRIALATLLGGAAMSVAAQDNPAGARQAEGMVVARDPATGQLRNATPAEVKALRAQEVQRGITRQQPPAPVTVRANGTRQKHLGERGLVYSIVSRDANGKLSAQEAIGEEAANAAMKSPAPANQQEHDHDR